MSCAYQINGVAFKYDKILDKSNIYEYNSFKLSWNYIDQN